MLQTFLSNDRMRTLLSEARTIAVIGAIMSDTSITMLMAAMVMGPLGGFCIKKSRDSRWIG